MVLSLRQKSNKVKSPEFAKNKLIASANPASLIDFEAEKWLANTFRMTKGEDYECNHVRGGDSVCLSVLRGESAAGIVCLSDLATQPRFVREQIEVVSVFAEVPNFIALAGQRIAKADRVALEKHLIAFSNSTTLGKAFEHNTGFTFGPHPLDQQMKAMDVYAEKTRRLLHI